MPDLECSKLDLQCQASQVALDGFEKIAANAGQFAGELIGNALTWWVRTPTPNPDSETVRIAQSYTTPIIITLMMAAILSQAIRMAVTRKKEPLLDIGVGLVRYVVVTTMGLMLLGAAVLAGDALSQWMLDAAVPQFAERMQNVLTMQAIANPFGLLIVALIAMVLGAIQWLIGFVRQAAILVLATLLPLAAAGSLAHSSKNWVSKMLPWLIALVAYKPMAAFIYVIGFTFVSDARDLTTAMTGIMVLLLAAVALPAMLRFFSWAVPVSGGGSGLASTLGSFAGAHMGSGGSPSGSAPQDTSTSSANRMENSGPGGPQGATSTGPSSASNQAGPGGAQPPTGQSTGQSSGQSAAATSQGAGTGGAAGTSGGAAGAGSSAGAGAAAGPVGAAAGAGVAVAKTANQGSQAAAGEMTGGSDDQQQ